MSHQAIMKNKILCLLWIGLTCVFSTTYAIEAPTWLRVSESDSTSVTIDWQSVPWAIGYYHYLGTESGTYTDGIDLIDGNEYTITDIDDTRTYYIAVTSVDEFGTESVYSEELVYWPESNAGLSSDTFRVSDVSIVDPSTLNVEFSRDLNTDTSATREFVLERKSTGVEWNIALTEVDGTDASNVIVLLDTPLIEWSEYEFTVLEVQDASGNTIESGIDAFISFTTPESFDATSEESDGENSFWLDSAPSTDEDNTSDTSSTGEESTGNFPSDDTSSNGNSVTSTSDTNANSEDTSNSETSDERITKWWLESSTLNQWNAGVTIRSEDADTDTMSQVAEENTSLPQTGPEHWVLLFIATLLGLWIFYRMKK